MRVVKIYETYGLTNISPMNGLWDRLIKEQLTTDEHVLFDFDRVTLNSPWKNKVFNNFIADPRVHMRIYTAGKTKETIISMLIMMGIMPTPDKVENIDIVKDNPDTYAKKQVKMLCERIKPCIQYTPATGNAPADLFVPLSKAISQVGSAETIKAIKQSIHDSWDEHPDVQNVTINLEDVIIQSNMYEPLAKLGENDELKSLAINFIDTKEDKTKRLKIYKEVGKNYKTLTKEQKIAIINDEVKPGTVVILNLMRPTKARNEFGQMDEGKYSISRPAIFLGYEKKGNDVFLMFRSFKKETFVTRRHWYLEHDMEEMTEPMKYQLHRIEINNIGYSAIKHKAFTGAEAQFNLPLQLDENGYTVTYSPSVPNVKVITVTLPEFIKIVLDDHNIRYDSNSLNYCISRTRKHLKSKGITPETARMNKKNQSSK